MKGVNKLLTSILSTASKTRPSGKRGNRVRAVGRRPSTRALPAAYAAHVRPRFGVASRTATSATVTGCDLIYPIPADLEPNEDTIFAIFPANPAYWTGTRISQFAPAYQNYRPLEFHVSYIPQVAVTQQGTVFMGTLWNEAAPVDNIQQSLFTSNGGCLTQCYVPCDTQVTLGANLQQNLFTLNDSLNPDTCPFIFLAGVRGASVVPGYFYVTYKYEFRNPIGSAWLFNSSRLTTIGDIGTLPTYANMTFVLAQQAGGFGPGTQLDLEYNGRIFYHGSEIELDASVSGIVYSNQQASITTNTLASYFNVYAVSLDAAYGNSSTERISNFDSASEGDTVSVPQNQSIVQLVKSAGQTVLRFITNRASSAITATLKAGLYHLFDGAGTAKFLTSSGESIQLKDWPNDANFTEIVLPSTYKVVELD